MFPFLVDVQSDLLGELNSRVVIPLAKADAYVQRPVKHLVPTIEFDGEAYVLLTPYLASIHCSELGTAAGSLVERRDTIIAAIEFLLSGV